METHIMRNGRLVCSMAEARKWDDEECMPVPGDIVVRFNGNEPPEMARISGMAIDAATEQRHREWVQAEGWKEAGHTAVAAANQV